jgi:peptidoglycan/xylan/chitin deacetylase (PgdA/CDA1 family)
MFIEQLPLFFRGVYKKVIWRKDSQSKTLYLTFDDGPIPEVTPWVLDVLDRYNIKATFFCVGENVWRYPDLYKDLLQRGHQTGNHTYNHLRGFFTSTRKYLSNVEKAAEYIQSDLFRPPHGELRTPQYFRLRKKYRIVQWDVITRDYNPNLTGEQVFGIVRKYARNGSVIVFHDSLKSERNMKYALPKAIEYLLGQGYTFQTL